MGHPLLDTGDNEGKTECGDSSNIEAVAQAGGGVEACRDNVESNERQTGVREMAPP